MTLEEKMNQADAERFDREQAELDAMPLLKGYCFMCEYYNCDCD
jgi:hypothetical protein